MCHFITMILPPKADIDLVRECLARHGRRCDEIQNRSISALMKAGEKYVCTTNGHCDCGTPLGSHGRSDPSGEPRTLNAHIARLRRKGWSQSKIDRWLDDKQRTAGRADDNSTDPDGWVACLLDLRRDAALKSIGLMVHFYRGSLSDPLSLSRQKVTCHSNLAQTLLCMKEDVIYDITLKSGDSDRAPAESGRPKIGER